MSLGDDHGYGGDRGHGGDPGRGGSHRGSPGLSGAPPGGRGQTRTRLPEGDSGPYGSARRPGAPRNSRSLVTVVAVVVLLIAAIAFANRGGGSSGTTDDAAKNPDAPPTAASGQRPVGTKGAGGIPSGFGHDEQGAQSAATNYAVTLGSDAMIKPATRHEIITAIYTTAAADRLKDALDKAYSPQVLATMGLDAEGNPPQDSTFVSRTVPVGAKVLTYSQDSARIAVWFLGLTGMAGQKSTEPVTSTWKTITFDLQWSNDDWKIVSDTETNGPAPVPGDDRASTADEIAKAVKGYGGFTYAR